MTAYYNQNARSEERIARLEQENKMLREALVRLRDCDWVISLPDRVDEVRAIAREALKETEGGQ